MRIIFKTKCTGSCFCPLAYGVAVMSESELLALCDFPAPGTSVDIALSGGPDSVGLTLLAVAAGLSVRLHHVNHHLRADSDRDAACAENLAARLGLSIDVYDVRVDTTNGVEAGARAARRSVLPTGSLTGHTMDDLAETVLLNLMRGAGRDGLSPMVGDPTKPLLGVRRSDLRDYVEASGHEFIVDPSNADQSLLRNDVRLRVLPTLSDAAQRDLVPVLARQAHVMAEESAWIDELTAGDRQLHMEDADCRQLREWHPVRLRRWLRLVLLRDDTDGTHPPTLAEVERVMAVVRGEVTATQISGGRRVARRDQHLSISLTPPATL